MCKTKTGKNDKNNKKSAKIKVKPENIMIKPHLKY